MMEIAKGLVIREPWIDLILSGRKTWEMRSQRIGYRGWIGLIRKGSGAISGIARIADVGEAMTMEELLATIETHQIPREMILSGEIGKWTVPWKLADIRLLQRPVLYRHPMGAITLFDLEPDVRAAIAAALGAAGPATTAPMDPSSASVPSRAVTSPRPAASPVSAAARTPTPIMASSPAPSGRLLGETELTAGNLKNNHFYLRGFLTRFPGDLIGGRDREPAILAQVEAGGMAAAAMDICPRHLFFRDRSWTRRFFEAADAAAGDVVQVTEAAPYRYAVSLRRRHRA